MRHRARITFRKFGDLRFIGHRDLVRVFERMLRRTGVGLALSQGFHPKAKLSFPLALAVGIEGAQESLEIEFSDPIDVDVITNLLISESPPGLTILEVRVPGENEKKPQPTSVEYRIPLAAKYHSVAQKAIDEFLGKCSVMIERPRRKKTIDARSDITELEISGGQLRFVQRLTRSAAVQPREILELLGLSHLEAEGNWITRSNIGFDDVNALTIAGQPTTQESNP